MKSNIVVSKWSMYSLMSTVRTGLARIGFLVDTGVDHSNSGLSGQEQFKERLLLCIRLPLAQNSS